MPRIYTRISPEIRFWQYVVKSDECWKWTGAKHEFGYGLLNRGGNRHVRAHRLSYEIHKGPIPEGSIVCHSCDNPECCNPEHLWLGSLRDNAQDCSKKGRTRGGHVAGPRHPRAKLTDVDILAIRAAYIKGQTSLLDIATPYGVTLQTVWRIVHGRTRI